MRRITETDLKVAVLALNTVTHSPLEYGEKIDGHFQTNISHYCLGNAYGGWELHRISNTQGAINVVSSGGYLSKRELFNQINCLINSLRKVQS